MGKCSVVLARIYAIIIFALFACLSAYYVYLRPSFIINSNPLRHHNIESKEIDISWQEYLQDCGGEKVIENFVATKLVFNEKYENNVVSWSGFYADVKNKNQGFSLFDNDHYMSILVKMSPSESTIFPDLVLSIGSQFYNSNKSMLNGLKKGDGLDFKGVLVGQGTEFKMHHLHGLSVKKNGQFMELSEIVVRESALP